jgi:hypothetical protein
MTIPGRVHNGVVVLEGDSALPEGAAVSVFYPPASTKPVGSKQRIQLPLVPSDKPGTLHLTNQQIAETLDEEDAAPRH